MGSTFRASMNWLHTWTGVVLGALLFAIFWMGTLSVFDREIDRWMIPATRLPLPDVPISLDPLRRGETGPPAGASWWSALLPTERQPVLRLSWRDGAGTTQRSIDPRTGTLLPEAGSWAGTRFIFPFHFALHLRLWDLGYWLVGVAGMAMLVLCFSGAMIHRRILADFFMLRVRRKRRRLVLDLHAMMGALAFPFHVAIAFSGLVIFFTVYFPGVWQVSYQSDGPAFGRETFGAYARAKLGRAGAPRSLDELTAQATRLWKGGLPSLVRVWHPGDAASYVEVRRAHEDGLTMRVEIVYFDAVSGALLHRFETAPVATVQRVIAGIHFIQFRHWTLRWLYFGLGLAGCVLVATGFLVWLEARRRRHAGQGSAGIRIVDGLAVGSVTGIIAATLSFFVANRVLPERASLYGMDRPALEIWTFCLVWLAAFTHAWLRPRQAWREQWRAVAVLAVVAVALNGITTGDHLLRSLSNRHLWPVGGMDVLLLLGALAAALIVRRLGHRHGSGHAPAVPPAGADRPAAASQTGIAR
jgi:uncharacterized iron-regulated membrane protein